MPAPTTTATNATPTTVGHRLALALWATAPLGRCSTWRPKYPNI